MATLAPSPPALPRPDPPAPHQPTTLSAVLLAVALVALLAANLPGFVCMPFEADVELWDILARTVSDGGVPYRDLLENNFPGMLWAHLGVRSVFGWRSEVLRAADVGVVAAIVLLLLSWLPSGCSAAWRLFL